MTAHLERGSGRSGRSEIMTRPTHDEIRSQLERILGHRDFEASARVRDLLRFVVEETLAGRDHRLKGYTVAVEVFGRKKDFDANLDPIVRIQAGRLRRALEHYYLLAGGHDPVVIRVPKGGYVPVFSRGPGTTAEAPAGSIFDTVSQSRRRVAVAVLPLQDMLAETEKGFLAKGLREELCNELSRYQDLVVIPCRMERLSEEDLGDPGELSRKLGARFFLEGSLRRSKEAARVSAWLIEAPHGQQVWSGSYTCSLSPSQFIETQEEIARNVAAAIGSELGVISQQVAQEARRVAPANLSTYEALLCFYHYQVTLSPELGRQCAVALEAGVAREPEHGPLWSALASLMGNAYLLDLPGAQDPGGQAAEFARRGADLAPGSQLARGVLARSHYLRRQRRAFVRELEFALSLNPGSPLYVGLAGYTLILAGDAERGRPLLEKAIEMNPCHPGWFNHALCVDEYMRGRYERAYEETLKPAFEVRLWGPLLRAAVLGQLGRSQEARAAASEILEVVPDFESRARDLTRRPIVSEAIVDALLDGLDKAGLRLQDA